MLNNKGFAVSTILYTILIAFLLYLSLTLSTLSNSASLFTKANEDVASVFYNSEGLSEDGSRNFSFLPEVATNYAALTELTLKINNTENFKLILSTGKITKIIKMYNTEIYWTKQNKTIDDGENEELDDPEELEYTCNSNNFETSNYPDKKTKCNTIDNDTLFKVVDMSSNDESTYNIYYYRVEDIFSKSTE